MAIRYILHHNHIEPLKDWLRKDGWTIQEPKGVYEVLRAIKIGKKRPLIIYTRSESKEHYSVDERDRGIIGAFIRDFKHISRKE